MDIHITKKSEVSVRDQLAEQLAFLMGTGRLKPGQTMPSVRALARELKIHHNTVSQVYQDLVDRTMLVRRRGSRMTVRPLEEATNTPRVKDLDDLINATIRAAQDHGYTLEQLRRRVHERLLAQPPDHILIVEEYPGLRQLLREEIKEKLKMPLEVCSPIDLSLKPSLAIGALVVCHEGERRNLVQLLPKDQAIFTLTFSTANEIVETVRSLREPSIIAVVSVSQLVLKTARGLLASAVGRRHTMREYLWPNDSPRNLRAADIVLCDSITRRHVKAAHVVHYHLVSSTSLRDLFHAVKSSTAG